MKNDKGPELHKERFKNKKRGKQVYVSFPPPPPPIIVVLCVHFRPSEDAPATLCRLIVIIQSFNNGCARRKLVTGIVYFITLIMIYHFTFGMLHTRQTSLSLSLQGLVSIFSTSFYSISCDKGSKKGGTCYQIDRGRPFLIYHKTTQ
ncbi:uncharacterized protein LOC131595770 isoform X1 [Vicia villosa]|uniref:uncharacterized protein LOC131595770 isoform X1 n=1 Tax=Vicia villosa TaxID=3911 RepID=UPI00273B3156|nr:uncharacterized protein LOC131595770 isoform X1 [Vicia villosa]XP_058724213.1 uncharacterized protein LOC131595770 isoform X1 [Vicia villosa]XP_058724214.1 uncharacterized protein LOC131595770 isoform X1 [Vicia villosa]XP_058724215.1 uncharacterized protein LOC131595770 isoform X1 [Vicia villosa]XP_058724216.1 uncharacterized protein LOC131595770 isoform X1 [Vicia villosa]XP_058724217.1 uncharacterized protein LOC131595770 isoform X1 [Vicia villosa]